MSANIVIDGQEMSLMDFAGVDLGAVEAKRFVPLPIAKYHFKVIGAEIRLIGKAGEETPMPTWDLEVLNCANMLDPKLKAEDQIGKKHTQSFYINTESNDTVSDSLGYVRAFVEDMGFDGNVALNVAQEQSIGHEFSCVVTQRKDKNDPEKIYVGFKNFSTDTDLG